MDFPKEVRGDRRKPQNDSDSDTDLKDIYKGSRMYRKRKDSEDNNSVNSRDEKKDPFLQSLEKTKLSGVTKLKSIHDQARDAEKRFKRLKFDGSEVIDQKVIEMMQSSVCADFRGEQHHLQRRLHVLPVLREKETRRGGMEGSAPRRHEQVQEASSQVHSRS